jgi:2-dehydro-3-deoxyphosphogluconate aldolase / (4S)-4-hydroxy-2-oxoglutarate aldolase
MLRSPETAVEGQLTPHPGSRHQDLAMQKSDVLSRIDSNAMVAMLRLPSADDALAMAEVLIEAGIRCIQVPLTVPGAVEVITELSQSSGPDILIAAGTVLEPRAAEDCLRAGAQFIVSPVFDLGLISRCNEAGAAVVAGAFTPTEILSAWRAGADMVRVYPCGALGGPTYVKFLHTPLPQIPLMPAGGVSLQTAADFIAAGASALEVDLDLVDLDALRGGRTEDITTNAKLYLDVVAQARSIAGK